VAHSLKGLVSNFDAEHAAKAAFRVEQLGKAGDLATAPAAIDELDRELASLAAALEQESARLSG
jgi:HPt (histidine-containing phosphotransfer) domain-containing protein